MHASPDRLLRHVQAVGQAPSRAARLAFHVAGIQVGFADPNLADALARAGARVEEGGVWLDDAAALPGLGSRLAEAGLVPWRGEAFDVRAHPDAAPLGRIDRGALPALGLIGMGVHVNGLVRLPEGPHLWVGRRSANRPLDGGKLDHLVAGGIPAGLDAAATLIKEAAEEAGIPAGLAATARPVGRIAYALDRPEGLRRDVLACYDLWLDPDFMPHPADGEATGFELWPLERVLERIAGSDDFKFNVALVVIDLGLRLGLLRDETLRQAMAGLEMR